jgi:hypothetical protein
LNDLRDRSESATIKFYIEMVKKVATNVLKIYYIFSAGEFLSSLTPRTAFFCFYYFWSKSMIGSAMGGENFFHEIISLILKT